MADDPRFPLDAVWILQVAPPARDLVDAVAAALSRRVTAPCRVARVPPEFVVPRLDGRNQADADRLLLAVENLEPPSGSVAVAFTGEDLGHPIFTHFFGRARHGGRAALVSSARLDPMFYGLPADPSLWLRRIVLEMLHEVGHLAGLEHCDDWACLMRFASTVEAIDNRGTTFCAECAATLPDALSPSFGASA